MAVLCIDKKKGEKLKNRGSAVEIQIIGPLTRRDYDYIRKSDITSLDLSKAEIEEFKNNRDKYHLRDSFAHAKKLEKVVLPDKLRYIYEYEFAFCSNLTSVIIPNSVKAIGKRAFSSCSSLVSINIPKGVTRIEEQAFYNCLFTSIDIPNGVTKIGPEVFYACYRLESIKIPEKITCISNHTFANCSALKSIALPSGLKKIKQHAFYSCKSLISIVIPDGVTEIGESAFENCSALVSINIPNSVKKIGKNAFAKCGCSPIFLEQGFYSEPFNLNCNDNNGNSALQFNNKKIEIEQAINAEIIKKSSNSPNACVYSQLGCKYTLLSRTNDEVKLQLLKLHTKYECLCVHTKETIFDYQFCPFSSKGCSFNTGYTTNSKEARNMICCHLNTSCRFMPVKCENDACDMYIERRFLKDHMKSCPLTIFQCEHCGAFTRNVSKHIRMECKGVRCRNFGNGCNFASINSIELIVHECTCKVASCPHCGKYVKDLKAHIRQDCEKLHCKNLIYGCRFYSTDSSKLTQHESLCTPEKVNFICDFCAENFLEENDLKQHYLNACTANSCCGDRYFTLDSLVQHKEKCQKEERDQ